MKLAMNMIRQYADIPVTPEEYTQRMIMTGTAVEGTEDISGGMEKVVVGRVLTCTDVEGTHLHECTVDVGGPVKQTVTRTVRKGLHTGITV